MLKIGIFASNFNYLFTIFVPSQRFAGNRNSQGISDHNSTSRPNFQEQMNHHRISKILTTNQFSYLSLVVWCQPFRKPTADSPSFAQFRPVSPSFAQCHTNESSFFFVTFAQMNPNISLRLKESYDNPNVKITFLNWMSKKLLVFFIWLELEPRVDRVFPLFLFSFLFSFFSFLFSLFSLSFLSFLSLFSLFSFLEQKRRWMKKKSQEKKTRSS